MVNCLKITKRTLCWWRRSDLMMYAIPTVLSFQDILREQMMMNISWKTKKIVPHELECMCATRHFSSINNGSQVQKCSIMWNTSESFRERKTYIFFFDINSEKSLELTGSYMTGRSINLLRDKFSYLHWSVLSLFSFRVYGSNFFQILLLLCRSQFKIRWNSSFHFNNSSHVSISKVFLHF